MKVLSAQQIKAGDLATIEREPITSVHLMERASQVICNHITSNRLLTNTSVSIFCGVGNNGGDGLVVGRLLSEQGYDVTVYIIHFRDTCSSDFNINLDRLKNTNANIVDLYEETQRPKPSKGSICIDAIFGVGLNRGLVLWVQHLIHHINESFETIISIDMPSGLFMDKVSEGHVIKATYTLTFQVPKLVLFFKDMSQYIGEWAILDIGIDSTFLKDVETNICTIDSALIKSIYQPRPKFSHKGTYGHGLIIGGEYGKIGATLLAAKACLYSGAGLVRVFVPKCGYIPLQTGLPEVMVITDVDDNRITHIPTDIQSTAIGIGIGMGTHEASVQALHTFLKQQTSPLVIDADGINILAKHQDMLKEVPRHSILTPHPKELNRLIGDWENDFDRLEQVKHFSTTHQLVMVVKGAHTQVILGNQVFINTTGNQGMATAGSGDVLTGIITGLLSQNYSPLHAAILGVYLHGLSGDEAYKAHRNYHTITASALIDYLPKAFANGIH